jgi:hypothetical protein
VIGVPRRKCSPASESFSRHIYRPSTLNQLIQIKRKRFPLFRHAEVSALQFFHDCNLGGLAVRDQGREQVPFLVFVMGGAGYVEIPRDVAGSLNRVGIRAAFVQAPCQPF